MLPQDPPILRIDVASPVPVYRQIVDGIRAMLVSGSFNPGDQLPTVRQLAMDLGVHHNTVAEAYRQLEQEGWLTLARRRGAIVQQRTQPTAAPDAKSSLDRKLRELAAHAISGGLSTTHVTEALFNAARDISSPARTQGELP